MNNGMDLLSNDSQPHLSNDNSSNSSQSGSIIGDLTSALGLSS